MTADIAAFMAARLDETEAAAKGVTFRSRFAANGHCIESPRRPGSPAMPIADVIDDETAAHIALHDPASTLRSIAADRRLLAELERCQGDPGWDSAIMLAVRCRAMAWNTHPEYKPGWAP